MKLAQFKFWVGSMRFNYPTFRHSYVLSMPIKGFYEIRIYLDECNGIGPRATRYYFETSFLSTITDMFNNHFHRFEENTDNNSNVVGVYIRTRR